MNCLASNGRSSSSSDDLNLLESFTECTQQDDKRRPFVVVVGRSIIPWASYHNMLAVNGAHTVREVPFSKKLVCNGQLLFFLRTLLELYSQRFLSQHETAYPESGMIRRLP
jgi:hypothetical protein